MPDTDQRSIQAWDAQATVASARSSGERTMRRMSWRKSPTDASVETTPSSRAAVRPSSPSDHPVGDQRDPQRAGAAVDALTEVEHEPAPLVRDGARTGDG